MEVVEAQLTALDDTDCYATAWAEALAAQKLRWGGRGQGGRGTSRRTFQPTDVVVDNVRMEYVGGAGRHARLLLENASLKILSKHVYALIGRNGCGKSSLLRRMDAGKIPGFPPHVSTLYIPQEFELSDDSDVTAVEFVKKMYVANAKQTSAGLRTEMEALEAAMDQLDMTDEGDQMKMEELATSISNLQDELDATEPIEKIEYRIVDALAFMGVSEKKQQMPLKSLSSGLKKKIYLAVAMVCPSGLLLLDEPTKQLDVPGLLQLRELIDFCQERGSAVVVVSHDRDLIDDVATDVMEIWQHSMFYYPGNYSDYLQYKQQHNLHAVRQAAAFERKRTAMLDTLHHMIQQPTPKGGKAKKKFKQIACQKKKMEREGMLGDSRKANAPSLESLDPSIRKGRTTRQMLELAAKKTGKRSSDDPPDKAVQFIFRDPSSYWYEPLIVGNDLGHGYLDAAQEEPASIEENKYPNEGSFVITKKAGYLFDCVDLSVDEGATICILGPSESGKSTLLKILAGKIKPLEGKVDVVSGLNVAFIDQEEIEATIHEGLKAGDETVLDYLMRCNPKKSEQDIRGELSLFGMNPVQVSTNLQYLSGGERCRFFYVSVMLTDPQVLIIDQPTANLDLESVAALTYGLSRWKGTLVMTSHDADFIREVSAACYALVPEEGKLRRVKGGVDEYLRSLV